jgi:hypothetical protein
LTHHPPTHSSLLSLSCCDILQYETLSFLSDTPFPPHYSSIHTHSHTCVVCGEDKACITGSWRQTPYLLRVRIDGITLKFICRFVEGQSVNLVLFAQGARADEKAMPIRLTRDGANRPTLEFQTIRCHVWKEPLVTCSEHNEHSKAGCVLLRLGLRRVCHDNSRLEPNELLAEYLSKTWHTTRVCQAKDNTCRLVQTLTKI